MIKFWFVTHDGRNGVQSFQGTLDGPHGQVAHRVAERIEQTALGIDVHLELDHLFIAEADSHHMAFLFDQVVSGEKGASSLRYKSR